MRWFDIILPEPGTNPAMDRELEDVAADCTNFADAQHRDGLDALSLMTSMEEAGKKLFKAVTDAVPRAFDTTSGAPTGSTPSVGEAAHDNLDGFHIVADPRWVGLPWTWLHNGLHFLMEQYPICAHVSPAALPGAAAQRPWMQRMVRAGFLVGDNGSQSLTAVMDQLQKPGLLPPEMLFIPGHSEPHMRRLIYREAEAISAALETGVAGRPLARLDVPAEAVTPSALCDLNFSYQALHFAGPVSVPARHEDSLGEYWMNRLIEESALPGEVELAEALGLEGEVLGVDPVTSLLDDICERHEMQTAGATNERSALAAGDRTHAHDTAGPSPSWLLEDGAVGPESLSLRGQIPPLVFSNSWCAVPELGNRFLAAGASTFIGPLVPLYSRPARLFAGHLYYGMGLGWCAGAAHWRAASLCRRDLGEDHPAWLAYGVLGFGNLSLQYL